MTIDMKIAPGALIVFEGLDKAGKTTQLEMLEASLTSPLRRLHMPSGVNHTTKHIYRLMEDASIPWTAMGRQLLHLACHRESMKVIQSWRDIEGLVLDRWWWSTVAYSNQTEVVELFGFDDWQWFCRQMWQGVEASKVFLFTHTYAQDDNNRDPVLEAYMKLYDYEQEAVRVPEGTPEEVHDWIIAELRSDDLLLEHI